MSNNGKKDTRIAQNKWVMFWGLQIIYGNLFLVIPCASDILSLFSCISKCSYTPVQITILTHDSHVNLQEIQFSSGNLWAFSSPNVSRGGTKQNLLGYSSILIVDITSKSLSSAEEIVEDAFHLHKSNRYRLLIFLTDEWNFEISFNGVKKHFSRNIYYLATLPEYRNKEDCKLQIYFSLVALSPRIITADDFSPNYTIYDGEEFCHLLSSIPLIQNIDLSDVEIRASAVDAEDSFLEHLLEDDGKGNLTLVSGTSVSLLNDLRDMMNFRIRAFRGEWIKAGKNKSLIGNSSQMLINDELDIHISHTTLLPYRAAHLDFLQPTIIGGIAVLLTQPEDSSFRDINTAPFKNPLWGAVILTILALTLSMKIGCAVTHSSRIGKQEEYEDSGDDAALLWGLSVVVQQGWFMGPESISLKIILVTGAIFGLLCYTAYSAEIVSILASDLDPISTFPQLISSNLPLFADGNSSTILALVEELTKDKGMKMRAVKYVARDDGVFQLLNVQRPCAVFSLTLFFYRSLRFYNVTDQWICKLMSEIPVNSAPTINSMVIRKNSIFREVFNHKIMWLKAIGLNHRYLQEYNRGIGVACTHARVQKDPLGVTDLTTAYYILGVGYLLCLGQLIAEKIHFLCTIRHKSQILN